MGRGVLGTVDLKGQRKFIGGVVPGGVVVIFWGKLGWRFVQQAGKKNRAIGAKG